MNPRTCKGVKCMQADCLNEASHKVGEQNIWDKDLESTQYADFNKKHELTTYLCDTHFNILMNRQEGYVRPKIQKPDNEAIAMVTDKGDPSVGIQEVSWLIECPFYNDADKEDTDYFRNKIKELYSEYSEGRIVVEFDFELKYRDE